MGVYTNFAKANVSGTHCFDARVLDLMVGYTAPDKASASGGSVIKIVSSIDATVVVDEVFVDKNGRTGSKDTNLDTVVLPVAKLAALPDDLQLLFVAHERVPGGYRNPKDLG